MKTLLKPSISSNLTVNQNIQKFSKTKIKRNTYLLSFSAQICPLTSGRAARIYMKPKANTSSTQHYSADSCHIHLSLQRLWKIKIKIDFRLPQMMLLKFHRVTNCKGKQISEYSWNMFSCAILTCLQHLSNYDIKVLSSLGNWRTFHVFWKVRNPNFPKIELPLHKKEEIAIF